MIGPLIDRLASGADASELRSWIAAERAVHFGLDENPVADQALAETLVAWWRQSRGELH